MENIIVIILCVALVVFGVMTLGQGFMTATDMTAMSVEDITVSKGEAARTGISILDSRSTGASTVEMVLQNAGQIKMASYAKWDLIVEYFDNNYTSHSRWIPYTEGTASGNEWCITGFFQDASANTTEVFEPSILNPAEEMKMTVALEPAPRAGTVFTSTIITPNGVTDSYSFTY